MIIIIILLESILPHFGLHAQYTFYKIGFIQTRHFRISDKMLYPFLTLAPKKMYR